MGGDVTIRRAGPEDLPAILTLARRSLGWTDDDVRFLRWKHFENSFGESPMWIASDEERLVGFRTFLRWVFVTPDGRTVRAVRAVDTATDPDYQGRGIFTKLTTEAIGALPALGAELVFNTPNGKSLPGYLKMGWRELGRLTVAVMPTSWRFLVVVGTARQPAGRLPVASAAGETPGDVFAHADLEVLLMDQPAPRGLTTARSRAFLQWRYGNPDLGYRVMLTDSGRVGDGFAVFRRRRRGKALEGVVCDVLMPRGDTNIGRRLVRRVARFADADYLLRIDGPVLTTDPFVRVPRMGPVVACRTLDQASPPALDDFVLSMGDIELF